MLKEFKEFAMRGNVLDMAIGLILGESLFARRSKRSSGLTTS